MSAGYYATLTHTWGINPTPRSSNDNPRKTDYLTSAVENTARYLINVKCRPRFDGKIRKYAGLRV